MKAIPKKGGDDVPIAWVGSVERIRCGHAGHIRAGMKLEPAVGGGRTGYMSSGELVMPPNASDGLNCPGCAYDLTGLPQDRCPECGMEGARAECARLRREWGQHAGATRWATAFFAIGTALPVLVWPADWPYSANVGAMLAAVMLACSTPALAWRLWDAEARGQRVGMESRLALLAAPHVMLALYLIRRRRRRELAIGVICCIVAVYTLGTVRAICEALWPAPGPYVMNLF